MKRVQPLVLALLCWDFGCSEPEASGTNTNWLRACATSAECGTLGCSCGVCTPGCDSDADCAALGGICSSTGSSLAECRGATHRRLCLPSCATSESCSSGQVCYRGACVHAAGAMNCADHPDALVCDDFEGTLDAYRPIVTSDNQVQTVAVATLFGSRALEAQVLVAPSTAYLRAEFAPRSAGTLSVRGWIQVPAGQTTYDLAPIGFWSEEEPEWALRIVAKDGRLQAWSYTTPIEGGAAISLGEWHCLESSIDIADRGQLRVALDGNTIIDVTDFDTLPVGGIGAVSLGSLWAGATATILIDRVVAGTTPSGCWD